MRSFPRRVPAGFQAGPALAVWAVALLVGAALSAVVSAVSLVLAYTPDATTVQLRAWGVLGPEEQWIALHADTPSAESGCLLTAETVVRWEERHRVAEVDLSTAPTVAIDRSGVGVAGPDQTLHCPSDPGSDLRTFAALIEQRARPRIAWHPGPDPRVAHLYQ